jgi:TetR/AcrR family transcriptional regulator, lmrAB and yxaGH operons repressor
MSPSTGNEELCRSAARPGARERLLRSAGRLFQARGFHGVGTAELLADAGVPRGSLYHHFPTGKSELAAAAAARLADDVVAAIQERRMEGLSPADAVLAIAEATAEWLRRTDYAQSSLLAALTAGLGDADGDLAAAVRDAYARIEAEYVRMLLAADLPEAAAGQVAREMLVAGEGAMILARAFRDAGIVRGEMRRIADRIATAATG